MSEYQFVMKPFSLDVWRSGTAERGGEVVGWFFYPSDDQCAVTFQTYAGRFAFTEVAKLAKGGNQWVICEWALRQGDKTALMLDLIQELGSRYREYLSLKEQSKNE